MHERLKPNCSYCLKWIPVLCFALVGPHPAWAEVTRFEITERREFADGAAFGDVGPYEQIEGKVHYAIDPSLEQNQPIVDLSHAPRDEKGLVHFSSDLFILAPKDLAKGNGAVLYDVNNRGNKLAIRFFNDSSGGNNPKSPGNGFLMRHGYTVVWSGWDGELLPGNGRLRLTAPTARFEKKPITGRVRYELLPKNDDMTRMNVNRDGHGAYRPTAKGLASATLTWRLRATDRRIPIPRSQFRLHVADESSSPAGQLPMVELELPAGFRASYLYELIYEAQDPLVHGVCFASVRDLMAAFKSGAGRHNPLRIKDQPAIQYAYGFGVSQSGRFLREMLYDGFNEDEKGKQVFDGLIPHVAGGGLGSFNHRFAQPTTFLTQFENHDFPSDRFPFSYSVQTDPLSGKEDGILRNSITKGVAPKVLHTQSAAEYWTRSGSLPHTDPVGRKDAKIPANVRVFAFGGTQHGPSNYPPTRGSGQNFSNHADYRPFLRSLLVALDRWCRGGDPVPPSVYPKIADGTLVPFQQNSTGFPALPSVRYPEVILRPGHLDLGRRWDTERIIDVHPPNILGHYQTLVPKCSPDGNDLGCLLPPEVAVPLATFTGWNLRSREAGAENELVGLKGSFIPFAKTKSDRMEVGDPRLSLEERFATLDEYQKQLRAYCKRLNKQRLLLDEDVPRIIKRQVERATPLFAEIDSAGER